MNSHSRAFEQYCCIMKRNIIIEEITFHDGRRKLVCTMHPQCIKCKNKILKRHFEYEKSDNTTIDIQKN